VTATPSTLGASFTLALSVGTRSSSPDTSASASGTKVSLLPKKPVFTVAHSGCPVWSSRKIWRILPITQFTVRERLVVSGRLFAEIVEQGGAGINDSVEAASGHRPRLEG